jgi:hypothetical protein
MNYSIEHAYIILTFTKKFNYFSKNQQKFQKNLCCNVEQRA